jgi:hypothetical protein
MPAVILQAYQMMDAHDAQEESTNVARQGQLAAAEASKFKPYNVRTSAGSASFVTPDQAAANRQRRLDYELNQSRTRVPGTGVWSGDTYVEPQYTAVNGAIGGGSVTGANMNTIGMFGPEEAGVTSTPDSRLAQTSSNNLDASQAASGRYSQAVQQGPDQYRDALFRSQQQAMAGQRALDIDRLSGGMGARGIAGHMVNDGGFNGQGVNNDGSNGQSFSGASSYNPLVSSAFRGFAEADFNQYNSAMSQSFSNIDRLLGQASGAMGLQGASTEQELAPARFGAELGGRQMSSNAPAYLNSAAQTSANGVMQSSRLQNSAISGVLNSQGAKDIGGQIKDYFRTDTQGYTGTGNQTGEFVGPPAPAQSDVYQQIPSGSGLFG